MNILEFENKFLKNRKIDKYNFRNNFVTLPCKCKEISCEGYAIVLLSKDRILNHCDNYMDVSLEEKAHYYDNCDITQIGDYHKAKLINKNT